MVSTAGFQPDRKQTLMPDADDLLKQALGMIDGGLSDLQSRELVAASEVSDLLLDLRLLLMQAEGFDDPVDAFTA